ncbi:MAG: hypothetical protein GX992_09380 [Clostridium sp.]|nr:hypothetical protein [Clostridium sp.]
MTKVKNLNGTSDRTPPKGYSSWREWWETKKGRKFDDCSCQGCAYRAKHGSHVQKVSGPRNWHIVPLCETCNLGKKDREFYVRDADLEPIH